MNNWVSVNDRLPEKQGKYLVATCNLGYSDVGYLVKTAWFTKNLRDHPSFKYCYNSEDYNHPGWYNGDCEDDWEEINVYYWMDLPEPPAIEEEC